MKKKVFGIVIGVTFAVVATVGVDLSVNKQNSTINLLMRHIEASADDSEGGVNYNKGYMNDPQSCSVSETVSCSISVPIKWLEWCKINFAYTVQHPGTQNFCKYTGGPSGCSFFTCRRN